MELLDQYFKLEKDIFEYFGYAGDCVKIPLVDFRDRYWILGEGEVSYSESPERPLTKKDSRNGDYYCVTIYRQGFLPKWVYPTDAFTMIYITDSSNRYLAVFDNTKRQTTWIAD